MANIVLAKRRKREEENISSNVAISSHPISPEKLRTGKLWEVVGVGKDIVRWNWMSRVQ